MQVEIIVAMLTSGGALVISVTQLIMRKRISREIEELKSNLDKSKKYSESLIETYTDMFLTAQADEVAFAKTFISQVQKFKELVKSVLTVDRSKIEVSQKIAKLEKSYDAIAATYAGALAVLQNDLQSKAHATKNKTADIRDAVIEYLNDASIGDHMLAEVLLPSLNIFQTELNNIFKKRLSYWHSQAIINANEKVAS